MSDVAAAPPPSQWAERGGVPRHRRGTYPAELWAPTVARRELAGWLVASGAAEYVAVGSLVLSELATNAVGHAQTPFSVDAWLHRGSLQLVVTDGSTTPPVVRQVPPDTEGGRGLLLVGELCSAWGVEPCPAGKAVWARIDQPDALAHPAR